MKFRTAQKTRFYSNIVSALTTYQSLCKRGFTICLFKTGVVYTVPWTNTVLNVSGWGHISHRHLNRSSFLVTLTVSGAPEQNFTNHVLKPRAKYFQTCANCNCWKMGIDNLLIWALGVSNLMTMGFGYIIMLDRSLCSVWVLSSLNVKVKVNLMTRFPVARAAKATPCGFEDYA